MISNKYSTSRMWALTKRYAVENRRNIFITLGVMFGIILLVSILFTKACPHDLPMHGAERGSIIWVIYIFIAGLASTIIGSLTFSSMSTKSKRISNLMLPAKQSEKFVSQCLLYVVGGNIALILSLFLSDTLSAVIFGFSPGWCYIPGALDIADIIRDPDLGFDFLFAIGFGGLWLFLFGQSIYVLGSALWPRKSFLKTFLAISVVQIVVPIFLPLGSFFTFIKDFWFNHIEDSSVENILVYGSILFAYAILVGVYYLAWQRYKRLEIVKRFLN